MAWSEHNDDLDTGISYRASTPNLQKLLDKVKARKRAAGEGTSDRNGMIMNYRAMSAKLDDLIEFAWKTQYTKPTLETVWRKLKKPSRKTISKIRKGEGAAQREYERLTPHVEDIANKLKKFRFSRKGDLIQFADPRPRNQLGEFSPQDEGGPDPNAMVKTYRIAPAQPGMAPNKQGHGLGGLAGLALVGGAAGATGAEAAKGAGKGLHALARKLGYIK